MYNLGGKNSNQMCQERGRGDIFIKEHDFRHELFLWSSKTTVIATHVH